MPYFFVLTSVSIRFIKMLRIQDETLNDLEHFKYADPWAMPSEIIVLLAWGSLGVCTAGASDTGPGWGLNREQ